MFECALALCLYADIAVGAGRDGDGSYLVDNTNWPDAVTEWVNPDNPFGRVSVGAEYQRGRYTLYLEGTHESAFSTDLDRGRDFGWLGLRVRF